jgi:hypothetical protein
MRSGFDGKASCAHSGAAQAAAAANTVAARVKARRLNIVDFLRL